METIDQTLIVYLIVVLTAGLFLWRMLTKKKRACGGSDSCGCGQVKRHAVIQKIIDKQ
ncbi:MAG: FeoB-associated Cys-rich membrane protein [Verrucomicrobiota bacterium]|nr:FeoB-associated Cys-rich membrane protein [Verrucomicrobiota bacterium]